MLVVKLSIYLSPILTSHLSKKGSRMIAAPLTSILRTANSSKNLLTLVNLAEKNEVMVGNVTGKAI